MRKAKIENLNYQQRRNTSKAMNVATQEERIFLSVKTDSNFSGLNKKLSENVVGTIIGAASAKRAISG
ncbi:hypothetical protein KP509_12G089200 [Ceratopteris richardii]|uniref:Uncharacterized protein n=1 Tax=Ceratopteris richardii TaxID=49495 RepID=A0A8T2TQS6_CERRI|nr:hypothetical protein KP509_12G089200 [Ceratopteris richardii]